MPAQRQSRDWRLAHEGSDLTENLQRVLAAPNVASKRWIFEQYDHMVRTNTLAVPGAGDAAVVRLKGTKRALALSTSGNGRWCSLDPRVGAMHAVAESARNVAAVGARPWAATNCLNFGNPEKPEVMWQFRKAVEGLAEACRTLRIPITGGNVSFYNETLGKSIDPTPVVGVLGLAEDATRLPDAPAFRAEGDAILLLDGLGQRRRFAPRNAPSAIRRVRCASFAPPEYARTIYSADGKAGAPPAIDLAAESRLIKLLLALAGDSLLASAHDLKATARTRGRAGGVLLRGFCRSPWLRQGRRPAAASHAGRRCPIEPRELGLFGERGARVVVSVSPANLARALSLAAQYGVTAREIGGVTRGTFRIQWNGQLIIQADLSSLAGEWAGALERAVLGRSYSES